MVTALHPEGHAIAVHYIASTYPKRLPYLRLRKVPTLVVIDTVVDYDKRRKISLYSEHSANDRDEALRILKEFHDWPEESMFLNYSFACEDEDPRAGL